MPRLIINPGSPDAWVQELSPGEFEIGRSEKNHLPLDHSSVSSTHCRLIVSESQAVLKDLGSVAGTFVGSELVEEARLQSGTVFRVGEVELLFEADTVKDAAELGGTHPAAVIAGTGDHLATCKWHSRVPARHFCPKCNHGYCDHCVEIRIVRSETQKICRKCGSVCQPLSIRARSATNERAPAFFRLMLAALTYPLRGNGLILIFSGGVLFTLLDFLPLVGLLTTGYVFNYAKHIVDSSARGEPEPPDWPDFTNIWDDILVPYGQLIAITVVTFGPAVLLALYFPAGNVAQIPLIILATIFGCFLAPIGMLALAMFDSVSALNPLPLLRSILRIPGQYFVAVLAFGLVVVAYLFLGTLLALTLRIPVLGSVLAGFLNLYLLAVAMRMLGILYDTQKRKLAWVCSTA